MTAPAVRDPLAVRTPRQLGRGEHAPARAAPRAGARAGAGPSSSPSTGSRRASPRSASSPAAATGRRPAPPRRAARASSRPSRPARAPRAGVRPKAASAPACASRSSSPGPQRAPPREILDRRERPLRLRALRSACPVALPQPLHEAQAEPHLAAPPTGTSTRSCVTSIGRMRDAVALRVLDQRRRVVEAHRPRVQQRRVERGGMVRLQVRARVRDQREARRVRLREAVQRERRDRLDDLRPAPPARSRASPCRARSRSSIDVHPLDRALEAHRAAQLLRLAAGEARGDHRDPQELLLEERHAERALQDRLEARMRVLDRRAPLPPVEERVHHAADDRARAG